MEEECKLYQAVFNVRDEGEFLSAVSGITERYRTRIVLFNADVMAGIEHVKSALAHARRSCASGSPISNSFEMEALLYAGGTRQCQEAVTFGIHPGKNRCYLCFCPPDPGACTAMEGLVTIVEEDWDAIDEEKMKRLSLIFHITPEEAAVVGTERFSELVLERVALLDVFR
jgi:KEOPS complex subunit Cgi121